MTNLQTISASWVICDSWAGVAGTIALAISQGGPITLIYGPILMLFLVGACALTLAELASVYPTAGGQYHWTSILAPKSINRSLVCSFLNLIFWQSLTVSSPELLLRYDKRVFLDCHLHRDRYYSCPADCGNCPILQSELHPAAVALFPHISNHKRMCSTLQHYIVEAIALDSRPIL
jgi:amino acid transporter